MLVVLVEVGPETSVGARRLVEDAHGTGRNGRAGQRRTHVPVRPTTAVDITVWQDGYRVCPWRAVKRRHLVHWRREGGVDNLGDKLRWRPAGVCLPAMLIRIDGTVKPRWQSRCSIWLYLMLLLRLCLVLLLLL